MRAWIFNIYFYVMTGLYAVVCVLFSLLPGRKMMMIALQRYTLSICWGMRYLAGIKVKVEGRNRVPRGVCILASKHLSFGDGHVIFSVVNDLSFVTGDQLLKIPLLKRILRKMNAVVIDSCGGSDARQDMDEQADLIQEQGRRILIFPEGHLSQIGTYHRYRKGVWHLYDDFKCPVVPIASNLGQRWNQTDWQKFPGPATVEFLEPIAPGMGKDAFMKLLQERIETRSLELLDYENMGALNPADVGQERENIVAKAKRENREKEEKTT